MASDQGDNEAEQQETHEPRECMACRGSGRVISNLGGSPSEVSCPWCGGTGMRAPGIDAQAHWPANDPGGAATAPAPPGSAEAGEGSGVEAGSPGAGEEPAASTEAD